MTETSNGQDDKKGALNYNYSADELMFNELYVKYNSLKAEKGKLLKIKQNLLILKEKNENIYKSLKQVKKDFEFYRSHLHKTLHNIKVSTDVKKSSTRKKLEEFLEKRKIFEEYYKFSPIKYELDALVKRNKSLEEEWRNKTDLLEETKIQFKELGYLITETFKNKVCEFSNVILGLKVGCD